jgi:hypothetical protein
VPWLDTYGFLLEEIEHNDNHIWYHHPKGVEEVQPIILPWFSSSAHNACSLHEEEVDHLRTYH